MRKESDRIATHLRNVSSGDYYVWSAFRGHGKKLADKAKKDGVDAIIYVRDEPEPNRAIHVTNLKASSSEATDDLLNITVRLPDPYSQASGSDD
jgi:histidyl-tRNA synthetase